MEWKSVDITGGTSTLIAAAPGAGNQIIVRTLIGSIATASQINFKDASAGAQIGPDIYLAANSPIQLFMRLEVGDNKPLYLDPVNTGAGGYIVGYSITRIKTS